MIKDNVLIVPLFKDMIHKQTKKDFLVNGKEIKSFEFFRGSLWLPRTFYFFEKSRQDKTVTRLPIYRLCRGNVFKTFKIQMHNSFDGKRNGKLLKKTDWVVAPWLASLVLWKDKLYNVFLSKLRNVMQHRMHTTAVCLCTLFVCEVG